MAEGNWAKEIIAVRNDPIAVTVGANSLTNLGMINDLINFPAGYSVECVTLMTGNENCNPFLVYNGSGISVYVRNFSSLSVTTGLYIRTIFVKQ